MSDASRNGGDLERERGERPIAKRPWPWLLLGVLLTLACLLLVGPWALNRLTARSESDSTASGEPTLIILTAPPEPTPSATSERLAPTPVPTFTPIVTPDTAIAPPELTIGFYAVVANTDNLGVTIRGGPGTDNEAVTVQPEGALVLVTGGPEIGEDFEWWQLQLADGTEGWTVGRFLEPAAGP